MSCQELERHLNPLMCVSRVQRFAVLGVGVDDVSECDVLQFARDRLRTRAPARLVTINVEYVMLARTLGMFHRVLNTADVAVADGSGVLWAMRQRGARLRRRVGGSDLIWSLSGVAASTGSSVFLLGGRPGVARAASEQLRARFPALEIAGTYVGTSSRAEQAKVARMIRQSGADILFVAFGAPAQDVWIAHNLADTGAIIALGVGGSYDYLAGLARRAPLWMQDAGLEWLWRLVREPWRWRRMLSIPEFVVLNTLQITPFALFSRDAHFLRKRNTS